MSKEFYDWCTDKTYEYDNLTGCHLIVAVDGTLDQESYIVEVIAGDSSFDTIIGHFESEDETRLAIRMLVKQAELDKVIRG